MLEAALFPRKCRLIFYFWLFGLLYSILCWIRIQIRNRNRCLPVPPRHKLRFMRFRFHNTAKWKSFFRRCWQGSRALSAHGASRNRCRPTDRHTDTEKRQGGRDVEMRRDTEILCVVEESKGTFLGSFWEWFATFVASLFSICSVRMYRTVPSLPASVRYLGYPICFNFKPSACWNFFFVGLRYVARLVSRHDLLFLSGFAALLIRDILVRIRMLIRILINGYGCWSGLPKHIRIRNTGTFTSFFKGK